MSPSIVRTGAVTSGGLIFLLAVGWPTIALLGRAFGGGQALAEGWAISLRQWTLLAQTTKLAAAAVGLSIVLSLPAAYLVGQSGRLAHKPWLVAVMVLPLLLPPMVYAFGWQRLTNLPARLQCVWVWSAWAWPIPALVIGSGWSRIGRSGYDAALLSTSGASAFVRVALPVLVCYVAVAGLVLLVLFLGEYSVPHACGLTVYATDLLGLAEKDLGRGVEVLFASLPLVIVLGSAVLVAWRLWSRSAAEDDVPASASRMPALSKSLTIAVVGLIVVTVAVPVTRLAWDTSFASWMIEAWRAYSTALLQSLGVSVGAGLIAVAMGIGLALSPIGRTAATVWTLVFGIIPGALVGEALVTAYLNTPLVYDNWPIVVLAYVARFGWIGILVGWLATKNVHRDLVAQARTDGADEFVVDTRVRLWPNWPILACGVCIVTALSLADVTAVTLVQIPSIKMISLTLIEKFHRFETGMLVSLSLWLAAAALPAAALLTLALRRRQ